MRKLLGCMFRKDNPDGSTKGWYTGNGVGDYDMAKLYYCDQIKRVCKHKNGWGGKNHGTWIMIFEGGVHDRTRDIKQFCI